jgi:hypothetical protein
MQEDFCMSRILAESDIPGSMRSVPPLAVFLSNPDTHSVSLW